MEILNATSALTPRFTEDDSADQSFKMAHWLGLYESHLFHNALPSTYERYSRALSKFYGHFPTKRFVYEFLRPDIETYKAERLREGASATTVNIELSILRGFFKWMLEVGADGAMLNPALGVRVRVAKRQAKVAPQDATESFPSTTVTVSRTR